MNNAKIDMNYLSFVKAKKANVNKMLDIIRRCVLEINAVDYTQNQIKDLLDSFTADWLENIIDTRHYYEAWYKDKIVACGGVSRDDSQEKQCYFTDIFVNPDFCKKGIGKKMVEFLENDEWCLDSKLIEIPSSKSAHKFYYKCGYCYRDYPPIFRNGTTIMYKKQ